MCVFPTSDKEEFFLIFLYTNSISSKCLPKSSENSLWKGLRVPEGYNLLPPFFLCLRLEFQEKTTISLERVPTLVKQRLLLP